MVQDMSQAGRRLQQTTPAADVRVRAQAADAAGASTARSQLQESVSSGKLAVCSPSKTSSLLSPWLPANVFCGITNLAGLPCI